MVEGPFLDFLDPWRNRLEIILLTAQLVPDTGDIWAAEATQPARTLALAPRVDTESSADASSNSRKLMP
jgi:hypothetical protein